MVQQVNLAEHGQVASSRCAPIHAFGSRCARILPRSLGFRCFPFFNTITTIPCQLWKCGLPPWTIDNRLASLECPPLGDPPLEKGGIRRRCFVDGRPVNGSFRGIPGFARGGGARAQHVTSNGGVRNPPRPRIGSRGLRSVRGNRPRGRIPPVRRRQALLPTVTSSGGREGIGARALLLPAPAPAHPWAHVAAAERSRGASPAPDPGAIRGMCRSGGGEVVPGHPQDTAHACPGSVLIHAHALTQRIAPRTTRAG